MGEHKLICHFDDQSLELYDVVGDIREETDLTGEKPELAEKMNARLQQWLFDTKAGIPQ